MIDIAELSSRLGQVTVVDVRRIEEYEGTLGNACDPRQGHIPGAVHFPVEEMVFCSDEEVRRVAQTASSPADLPPAEELYNELAQVMGLEVDT